MLDQLKRLEALRGAEVRAHADRDFHERVIAVKRWQQARLARTYADLARDARYMPAVNFFLEELYGPKDSSARDRDLIRMVPTIKRLLPKFAFDVVASALELDVLSEGFDQSIAKLIGNGKLDDTAYVAAFRTAGRREDRLRQVALLQEVGRGLDVVVKKPLIYSTLKLLRKPAQLAGMGEMQCFLEVGFTAFRHMDGASYFLETIASRETILIERIMEDHPDPLAVVADWEKAAADA